MQDDAAGRVPGASREDRVSDARALAALDVAAHLADPTRKQAFVTPMFDVIAPRYDDFTRLFSFGMDAGWKQRAVEAAAAAIRPPGPSAVAPLALDVACGTGDLAFGVARAARAAGAQVRVLGVDAAGAMVRAARARLAGAEADVAGAVTVARGDMTALPVANGGAALVTAGYAVRNAPDPDRALAEFARVLRPGGSLVTLDFYRPEVAVWRAALLGYLRVAGDLVGWSWHRAPVVYGYIARSIQHFVSWQAFAAALGRHGFRVRAVRRWLGGGVALHVAERR
jgi:demethylmenaquinone methyltransferase/2-methoxy-6-polyprenyl-1,4-benzoquinol methylase